MSQTFFTVVRLLRPETYDCQEIRFASRIILLVLALLILKSSRFLVVGCEVKIFSDCFLAFMAALQLSSNQGFFIRFEVDFVLGIVFSAIFLSSWVKLLMSEVLQSCCWHISSKVDQSALLSFHLLDKEMKPVYWF